MPKIKTHKATAKRVIITKGNKLKRKRAGQDHFNAREDGATKRRKRRDISISKRDKKNIKKLIPYN